MSRKYLKETTFENIQECFEAGAECLIRDLVGNSYEILSVDFKGNHPYLNLAYIKVGDDQPTPERMKEIYDGVINPMLAGLGSMESTFLAIPLESLDSFEDAFEDEEDQESDDDTCGDPDCKACEFVKKHKDDLED